MEKTKFVYKAFISYTARDTQFVNKLEEWLIHLSENADADQKYKFFRDSSYSEAGESVEESLKQKLKESEWLILVCSPYINDDKETERNWVDFECSYYAYTLERKDNIVCIISNSAPLDRNISLFYPESIRDLREKLAADMRGNKEWGKETSRIYAKITGRRFEDVYNIANTFYWENRYYDIVATAYKKNKEGNNREALRIMSEIPDNYNPCKIEWNYLKALCSRSAYNDYCGFLNQPAGNKVICFDSRSSFAYSTDNKYLYAINCLDAEVVPVIEAHDGKIFRFFYMGEGYICTFDDHITIKLWKYDREKITLIKQTVIKVPFSESEPAVFKSFYPDCQLNHIPASYHHQARLLALTVRHNLFLLNMETMEYKTMDIPPLKRYMAQLSCVWKNLVFSENAEMLFLTDDRYLLGWNLNSGNYVFFWNRKRCQPPHYTLDSESNIFKAENTTYSIHIYDNGQKAEWKEDNNTLLFFNTIPHKKLNSVYAADKGDDYIILLYEGNIVQVLERSAGIVYWENVPVEQLKTGLDFSEAYCPVVLWQGELWHIIFRQMHRPFWNEGENYPTGKPVIYNGVIAAASHERKSIAIYNESGQLLAEKEVCIKKQPKMLSDAEMNLPPTKMASELLRKHICRSMDQEIYECNTYAFIDERNLLIGCTKGYLYLWDIESNVLSEIDNLHKKDITVLQIYQQCNTVITADSNGMVVIWKYRKELDKISVIPVSSFHTQKTNIMLQLMPGNGVAVFCNDTGELKLYTELNEENIKIQTLLSADAAKAENICHVLSMYVTTDLSRLVFCRKNQIDFVRLPDGKLVLESEIHGEIKNLKIYDDEKMVELSIKDHSGYDYKETYYIANLTDKEYDKLLLDRRLHFFSNKYRPY